MKFDKLSKLIFEYDNNFSVLSRRTFEGVKNKIRVELQKYNGELKPRIYIYSLNDPNKAGFVEYDSKIASVRAYNNLDSLLKVLDYMGSYSNEHTSYNWVKVIRDEDIDIIKKYVKVEPPSEAIGTQLPPEEPTPSIGNEENEEQVPQQPEEQENI